MGTGQSYMALTEICPVIAEKEGLSDEVVRVVGLPIVFFRDSDIDKDSLETLIRASLGKMRMDGSLGKLVDHLSSRAEVH